MSGHTCTRHDPGSDACYTHHACRCDDCRHTHGAAVKRRHHANNTGTPCRIPAEAAVAHLQALLNSGMGRAEIGRQSGIHGSNLANLLRGDQQTLRPAAYRRLMAVKPTPVEQPQVGEVDSIGARRRIQALMAIGWHPGAIARAAGINPQQIRRILDCPRIFAETRRAIVSAYDQLWNQTPEPTLSHLDARARNTARRNGWQPPMAWDDDQIDKPTGKPRGTVPGTIEDRIECRAADIEHLLNCGESHTETAKACGFRNHASMLVWLRRNGRDDLADRIMRDPATARKVA